SLISRSLPPSPRWPPARRFEPHCVQAFDLALATPPHRLDGVRHACRCSGSGALAAMPFTTPPAVQRPCAATASTIGQAGPATKATTPLYHEMPAAQEKTSNS